MFEYVDEAVISLSNGENIEEACDFILNKAAPRDSYLSLVVRKGTPVQKILAWGKISGSMYPEGHVADYVNIVCYCGELRSMAWKAIVEHRLRLSKDERERILGSDAPERIKAALKKMRR